jgi:hypothetical protein
MSVDKSGGAGGKQSLINFGIAFALGQVGCLTLIIIIVAILAGMWLDEQFHTNSILTFGLIVLSIPLSIIAMLGVVRSASKKIIIRQSAIRAHKEETDLGKNQ